MGFGLCGHLSSTMETGNTSCGDARASQLTLQASCLPNITRGEALRCHATTRCTEVSRSPLKAIQLRFPYCRGTEQLPGEVCFRAHLAGVGRAADELDGLYPADEVTDSIHHPGTEYLHHLLISTRDRRTSLGVLRITMYDPEGMVDSIGNGT